MTSPDRAPALRQALECAARGWPVFPCHPGRKTPATRHGYLDATTDPALIRAWLARYPDSNLAVATGTPGPDILDIDQRGPAGNGFAALAALSDAGLLTGASARIRTPSGGTHLYFAGTRQRSAHLPRQPRRLPRPGRLHPHPALSDRRHPLPARRDPPRSRPPGLARRHPAAGTRPRPPAASRPRGPRRPHRLPRPLGRRPARGQPQRRPVLGRQPRSAPGGRRPSYVIVLAVSPWYKEHHPDKAANLWDALHAGRAPETDPEHGDLTDREAGE